MTSYQVALFQLDNYGPWTTTPSPRPEPTLQALQARLYADIVSAVGDQDGYAFYGRFDNMVGITPDLSRDAYRSIQRSIATTYPISVSIGLGDGQTPATALATATDRLQAAGSAQEADRQGVLAGETVSTPSPLQVAHFDIVDVTNKYTDQETAYETLLRVRRAVSSLSAYLYDATGAITFFVGGDNAIAVCPDLSADQYHEAIAHVNQECDVEFQVGIGRDIYPVTAGLEAKEALEVCRETGTRVEGPSVPAPGE